MLVKVKTKPFVEKLKKCLEIFYDTSNSDSDNYSIQSLNLTVKNTNSVMMIYQYHHDIESM